MFIQCYFVDSRDNFLDIFRDSEFFNICFSLATPKGTEHKFFPAGMSTMISEALF